MSRRSKHVSFIDKRSARCHLKTKIIKLAHWLRRYAKKGRYKLSQYNNTKRRKAKMNSNGISSQVSSRRSRLTKRTSFLCKTNSKNNSQHNLVAGRRMGEPSSRRIKNEKRTRTVSLAWGLTRLSQAGSFSFR